MCKKWSFTTNTQVSCEGYVTHLFENLVINRGLIEKCPNFGTP